jgi:hypothetical protein
MYNTSCVILNADVKKNLQRVALRQHASLSTVLNLAGKRYIEEYLKEHQDGR